MKTIIGRVGHSIVNNPVKQTSHTAAEAKRLLADIRALAPDIAARAAEIERVRRIPLDLVEELRSIGVFRMFVAESYGGLELDLPTGLGVVATLARIDGSVGWCAMIGSAGGIFAPWLPRETFDRIYRSGPDAILAGTIAPFGTAEATDGGFLVNGRWPFASGCQHADWIAGFCVMTEGGNPVLGEGGRPLVRGVVLPARDWQIVDTWHVMGLCGTGSHDIALKDAMVSEAHLMDLEHGVPCLPGPLYQAVPHILPLFHSAFAVGVAEAALDDLLALAESGRQQQRAAVAMRESEIFQFELGQIAADIRAARACLEAQVASHWRHALARTLKDETVFIQGAQTGAWIAATCVRATDSCFALAGGSAVYDGSALQRRMRDLHAAAQHAVIHRRHYVAAGRAALAQVRSRLDGDRQLAAE
jgi:alkylation response protein AidB-like acyl-CoA dehydrogenase